MERTNSIKFVGDISRTGKHQSGQVFARGGCIPTESATQDKHLIMVVRKWKKLE